MEKEILTILQSMQSDFHSMQGELKEIKTDLREHKEEFSEFKQQVKEKFVEVDTRFDKIDTQLHRIEYENQHAILSMLQIQSKKHEEHDDKYDYLLHIHINLDKDFHTFKNNRKTSSASFLMTLLKLNIQNETAV